MSTTQDFIEYILDCLRQDKRVATKKIFGKYAIYEELEKLKIKSDFVVKCTYDFNWFTKCGEEV